LLGQKELAMLVVSRGINDRLVFPALGITVKVIKVKGSRASLGIDAPSEIRVIRHELLTDDEELGSIKPPAPNHHEFRNQIHKATLKIQLAAKYFAVGETSSGLASMAEGIRELNRIEEATDMPASSSEYVPSSAVASSPEAFSQVEEPKAYRVLLVDDDANERALMASYLERCGMHVEQASDGLKALYSLSKSDPPDVILLDMNMPNLDGPATIQRIRECSPHPTVPVFAVTGESIERMGLTISDNCVNGWFQKPLNVDDIVNAISTEIAA
jgi:carbon storage regulator CsrA